MAFASPFSHPSGPLASMQSCGALAEPFLHWSRLAFGGASVNLACAMSPDASPLAIT